MAQQQGQRQGNQDLSRHLAEGKQNEEGFLEMAFHPKFKENGQFFVFYTDVNVDMANVVSRFRVKKDDPNSEEEIIRFEKPFWNHDSSTITSPTATEATAVIPRKPVRTKERG